MTSKVFDDLKCKLAEDPSSFLVILGAGASIPAGIPSWSGLKDKLCEVLSDIYQAPAELEENLQSINNSPSLWIAFSRLRSKLGAARYEREIKKALNPSGSSIPRLYKQLWQLNVAGIIDFNLDCLALDAYSDVYHKHIDFATSCEPHKYKNYPLSEGKFVFHPHGIVSDSASWIFTDRERQQLYANSEFKLIMSNLLNSKNLLIIGFNVTEGSFTQLIADCCIEEKLNGAHNYYFCPNATPDMQIELGDLGISVVSYNPTSVDHTEINNLLDIIQKYDSVDSLPSTIYTGKKYTEADIPSETESHKMGTTELRNILNGVVAGIIPHDSTPTDEQMQTLERFYNTYITQLHRAWLVDPRSENTNTVYGYKAIRLIGSGAFGTVYEAEDDKKNRYALKVLLPEVKDNMSYLSCFRRGIRSMRILTEKGIDGMVKICDSYEIPACLVMDMIDGVTLREAVDRRYLLKLDVKLSILVRIATIIHNAHQLEERILHRDLKPENIILQDCYGPQDFEDFSPNGSVKILDFDLSWHRGATEKTVAFGAISQGFMAPEQIDTSIDRSLSRNTSVDVYSLGMLAYFVLTNRNPMPNESQFAVFPGRLLEKLKKEYSSNWKSLPQYLCNTILSATCVEQFDRMPLSNFIGNLKIAYEMYHMDTLPNTHPLVLSELTERMSPYTSLSISDFGRYVSIEYATLSKRVVFFTKSQSNRIILTVSVERYANASDRRDGRAKYFNSIGSKAAACADTDYFSSASFENTPNNVVVRLSAFLPNSITRQYIEGIVANILEIRRQMDL